MTGLGAAMMPFIFGVKARIRGRLIRILQHGLMTATPIVIQLGIFCKSMQFPEIQLHVFSKAFPYLFQPTRWLMRIGIELFMNWNWKAPTVLGESGLGNRSEVQPLGYLVFPCHMR